MPAESRAAIPATQKRRLTDAGETLPGLPSTLDRRPINDRTAARRRDRAAHLVGQNADGEQHWSAALESGALDDDARRLCAIPGYANHGPNDPKRAAFGSRATRTDPVWGNELTLTRGYSSRNNRRNRTTRIHVGVRVGIRRATFQSPRA